MFTKRFLSIVTWLILLCLCLFAREEKDKISFSKLGDFEVFVLVEAERPGNASILLNVEEEILERYIPEEGFLHSTNVFLIKTPERVILVDTGTGSGGVILEKIRSLEIEPEDIDTVLLTHLHFDHFGGLQTDGVANFPNAQVYVSVKDYEYFTKDNAHQVVIDVLGVYGENINTFEPAELGSEYVELLAGVKPIANYGHTPGHTIFLIESRDEKLLIAGDFLHLALVQFAHPEISATFDVDPVAAAVSRRAVLDYAVRNGIPVGGMHMVMPGIRVNIEADGDGFK